MWLGTNAYVTNAFKEKLIKVREKNAKTAEPQCVFVCVIAALEGKKKQSNNKRKSEWNLNQWNNVFKKRTQHNEGFIKQTWGV